MSYKVFAPADSGVLQLGLKELLAYGKGCFEPCSRQEAADILLISENSSGYDDAFSLISEGEKLFIRGSNCRSVLYGIFDYLRTAGFDFLYPGKEGEIIPENPVFTTAGFAVHERADRRFRGIAAAPDPENLQEGYDLIRFMVQNKYNLFFMEGFDEDRPGDEYSIIDGVRPLQHVEYLLKDKTWEERREIARRKKRMVDYARQYGLLIERGGHGWNYGVPEHYAANHGMTPGEGRELLRAKGKVNQLADVQTSTWFQLCLCRDEVRGIYADHIIRYLKEHHHEMDIAAIWLGDGYDNKCQCEACLQIPFSDWYMDIFRKVALWAQKELPDLKLECLIYFETLEPPTGNALEGLNNVILNFAVWRHCYFHALDDEACRLPDWIPDYRNNASHDRKRDMRIINFDHYAAYGAWRRVVGNRIPCLIFNYITLCQEPDRHFMSYDMAYLARHFKDYDRMDFDGMVDCQCHASWDKPVNLQLYGAGRILWDQNDDDAGAIRQELLEKLFGGQAPAVAEYCDRMARLLESCGDYHHSLHFTPEKAYALQKGLQEMESHLAALGTLPRGRERYFRESLSALQKIAGEYIALIPAVRD